LIANIVDKRAHRYRWKRVHVIVEATFHDNSVAGSDPAEVDAAVVEYAELDDGPLADAIAWAQAQPGDLTLFIYDAEPIV
jgi:hypothetical protein